MLGSHSPLPPSPHLHHQKYRGLYDLGVYQCSVSYFLGLLFKLGHSSGLILIGIDLDFCLCDSCLSQVHHPRTYMDFIEKCSDNHEIHRQATSVTESMHMAKFHRSYLPTTVPKATTLPYQVMDVNFPGVKRE